MSVINYAGIIVEIESSKDLDDSLIDTLKKLRLFVRISEAFNVLSLTSPIPGAKVKRWDCCEGNHLSVSSTFIGLRIKNM